MNSGKSIFSQLMDFLPAYEFRQCVERYQGNYKLKSFSCWDQFLCMAFAQLTYRESLRDIEACLRANQTKLYHLGIRGRVSRNTLAHANSARDWHIYADFAHLLIKQARELYLNDDFGLALEQTVYALDATTIDLCLSLFPWAYFRKRKGAVKLHTLLDLRGNIPTVIIITHGLIHDVHLLDQLTFEPGAFYVMDRAYLDFPRLHRLHLSSAFFVTRAKKRFDCRRLYSQPVDRASGVMCDQLVVLVNPIPRQGYPDKLRRIRYFDNLTNKRMVFLTNNFTLPPLTIAQLVVLQMDQTTSAHQEVLRHFRECAQDPNLDRHLYLRPGSDCQKAIETGNQPLQNSTNPERHALRKNPDSRGPFIIRLRNPAIHCWQTIDPVPLILGQ